MEDFLHQRTELIARRHEEYEQLKMKLSERHNSESQQDEAKRRKYDAEVLHAYNARESLNLRACRAGVSIRDFEIIDTIGHGAYSTVQLVRHKQSGKIYALKQMEKTRVSTYQEGIRVRTERAVMLHLNSPFIVKLHYVF